mmetsp:Transcript_69633/g.110402  ORF Transcript_69633/g.110402 Transcript_69633/m.110402 type:complete len:186 (+) Transcript_69633:41-598(+)
MLSTKQEKKRGNTTCSTLTWLFLLFVIGWQCLMVKKYTTEDNFPDALWNGRHIDNFTKSCRLLYTVTHWSAFFSLCTMALELLIVVAFLLIRCGCWCTVFCLPCENLGLFLSKVCQTGFGISGIVVAGFLVDVEEITGTCDRLYSCVWWTFIGFLGINLCLYFFMYCCLGTDRLDEMEPLKSAIP